VIAGPRPGPRRVIEKANLEVAHDYVFFGDTLELGVLWLVGVAARQKDSENDDEGRHANACNERGDEGTHRTSFCLMIGRCTACAAPTADELQEG
jgi:hypothetical protein